MKLVFKYLIVFICFVSVFAFSSNIAGVILVVIGKYIPLYIREIISFSVALSTAFVVARFVWKKTSINKLSFISSSLIGGFILGSIGFIGGFIGPIIFSPTANQGPLLGIFITGPLGFILGIVASAIYWKVKLKK